ncbi:MAG: SUMF1/EgtB/PvdO family nonheme iron enzyme [Actinobacteria bacterium]|nr:SUMF1/EgtB/PvdO family nonheme iron enzyme [Actinomycetota bacterium]
MKSLEKLSEQWQSAVEDVFRGAPAASATSQAPSGLIDWVEVPGGTFLFGKDNKPTEVPTFWISRYPVTRGQYDAFVKASGHQANTGWRLDPQEKDHPATVDFFDAKAFSQWAGCRLPREAEWEKAGRGTDGRRFPWGGDWDPEKCKRVALRRGGYGRQHVRVD